MMQEDRNRSPVRSLGLGEKIQSKADVCALCRDITSYASAEGPDGAAVARRRGPDHMSRFYINTNINKPTCTATHRSTTSS